MNITPIPDRAHEPQAEPCATHEVACVVRVRAQVAEGITPEHLLEYIGAFFGCREHTLHEDIFDEVSNADIDVQGWPTVGEGRMAEPDGTCPACHGIGYLLVRHEEPCAACAGTGRVPA